MKIEEMDLKELKVMAYDLLASIQQLQNDLMNINVVITRKSQIKPISIPEKKEEEKK